MVKAYIDDIPDALIEGANVLCRFDLSTDNLLNTDSSIIPFDITKLHAACSTLHYLIEKKVRCICILTHLGKPSLGSRHVRHAEGLSTAKLEKPLRQMLQKDNVYFVNDCIGLEVQHKIEGSNRVGDIFILENVRFYTEEEQNDPKFALDLGIPFQIYVNDAFSMCMNHHASIVGVTRFIDISVGGLQMRREVTALSTIMNKPKRPFVAIVGGGHQRITEKLTIMQNLLKVVDKLIIGGALAFTFYRALGLEVGDSLVEESCIAFADSIIREAEMHGVAVILPSDVVVIDSSVSSAPIALSTTASLVNTVRMDQIPAECVGFDVGSQTIRELSCELEGCKTIFWTGPLGQVEKLPFARGTHRLIDILSKMTAEGETTTIACGDATLDAIRQYGTEGSCPMFTLLVSGGTAALQYLEGRHSLPGLNALWDISAVRALEDKGFHKSQARSKVRPNAAATTAFSPTANCHKLI